jgi:hypothetical protein
VPEVELVTVFCPLTTVGAGETGLQTIGGLRFVVDCKVNPTTLAGHDTTTLAPERIMVSNERLNTVPLNREELPPSDVVPYRVVTDKINPACG